VSAIDWLIVVAYLVWMVWDGLRRTKDADKVEGYFLANRSLPWWAVGLSVMATQLSAITLVGTTGQAYSNGLGFVQFYFGLPIAMIILSLTVVPFFTRARVYTAYEYLERRFDVRVRTLASFLFLMGRAFALGVTLAAPAVVISAILGWSVPSTVLVLAVPMVIYTSFGGVQAVAWTDVKQMFVIVIGVLSAIAILVLGITRDVSLGQAMELAGATGRLQAIDTRFDLRETYTIWSGFIGGLFLFLSYFGCDQSQVQRYLTAKSIDEARHSLLMSAFVKIPLQLMILGAGVLVFVFYIFQPPPMLFNRVHDRAVADGPYAAEYAGLQRQFDAAVAVRKEAGAANSREAFLAADARLRDIRARAAAVVKQTTGDQQYTDVNYVFPTFITTHMPVGLVGLMIAAMFAAAMSTASGELSALSTATIIDFYRRHFVTDADDRHYLRVSKGATAAWGLFACVVSMYAANQGSLIEVVNRYGSFFYGSLLGVFILAIMTKRATASGAFWGLIAGMVVVLIVAFTTPIAFLWHNLIGAAVVYVVGMTISLLQRPPAASPSASAAGFDG
jgi:SSS family solute:Na+ symporter